MTQQSSVNIRIKRDTASNWTANNPILKIGEPGLETDTRKLKFGDGVTRWNNLLYSNSISEGIYASLVDGKVPSAQLPSYVDDVVEYANLAAFPVSGEISKIYVDLNNNKIYRWNGSTYIEISPSPGSTDSISEGSTNKYYTDARASAAAPVQSVAGKTGNVTVNKNDIGLGNVDNTSDANKPVSTAQQTALDGKASLTDGKVPSSQLPSYVDDVIEAANLATLPSSGETGKIYVTLDSNKVYRWSGSVYIEISPSPGSTDSVTEGSVNLYYTNSRASAAAPVQSVNGSTGIVTIDRLVKDGKTVVLGSNGSVTLPGGSILSETNNTLSIAPPTAQSGQSLVVRPTAAIWAISSSNYIEYGNPITIVVTLQNWAYFGTVNYTISGSGVTPQSLGRALTGKLTFVSTTGPDAESITWTIPANSNISEFTLTLTSVDGTRSTDEQTQNDPALYYDFEENAMPIGQFITVTNNGISSSEHSHVHLVAGDPSTVDIYLGDDDQYVKIEKDGGDVVIGTNSNANHWIFDNTGGLTLPNGTNIDAPSAQSRAGAIAITNSTELLIETNSNTTDNLWTFGIDGSTILPENTLKGYSFTATNSVINYIPQAASFLYTDNPILGLISTIGGAWYIKGPGLIGWKQITAIQDNSGVALILRIGGGNTPLQDGSAFPSGGGNVYTISQYVEFDLKVADKTWKFKEDGNLTLPVSGSITFPDNTFQNTANIDGGYVNTYYFSGGEIDNLADWISQGYNQSVTTFPTSNDFAVISGSVSSGSITLLSALISSGVFSGTINAQTVYIKNNAIVNGTINCSNLAIFYDTATNQGNTVNGDAKFMYLTAANNAEYGNGYVIDETGYANGNVTGDTLDSVGEEISNWVFDGTNLLGTVKGNAIFINTAYKTGNVIGNATFLGSSRDDGGTISGTATYSSDVNGLIDDTYWYINGRRTGLNTSGSGYWNGSYWIDGVETDLPESGTGSWNGAYYIAGVYTTLEPNGNGCWDGFLYSNGVEVDLTTYAGYNPCDGIYYINGVTTDLDPDGNGCWNNVAYTAGVADFDLTTYTGYNPCDGIYYINGVTTDLDPDGNGCWNDELYVGGATNGDPCPE